MEKTCDSCGQNLKELPPPPPLIKPAACIVCKAEPFPPEACSRTDKCRKRKALVIDQCVPRINDTIELYAGAKEMDQILHGTFDDPDPGPACA